MKHGEKIIGEKRMDAGCRMTWHWAHFDSNNRAYKCTCARHSYRLVTGLMPAVLGRPVAKERVKYFNNKLYNFRAWLEKRANG